MGISLTEVMVGLTIGMLIVLAAIGSLIFTHRSATGMGDSARLQQRADAVFRNLSVHLVQAAAINMIQAPNGVVFDAAYTGLNPAITGIAGQVISVHGVEGSSNAPDTLSVSYQDNMLNTDSAADRTRFGVRDCLGERPNPEFVNVDNRFRVVGTNLMCRGATNAAEQSIADGVEDFQVTYGVLTVVGGANPNRYQFFNASQVTDWTNVQAVSICLQLIGEIGGNPQPGLVTKGCRDQTLANDGFLRRVFRRTFSLRNTLL